MRAVLGLNALAMVLLAAHVARSGYVLAALLSLCVLLLFLERRRWVLWVMQAIAYAAAASWVQTALNLVAQRQAQGRPWTVAALILGTAALFSATAGLLLNLPVMRKIYTKGRPVPPVDPQP